MSERHPNLLIADIVECGERILDYTRGMSYDEFITNNLVKDAVIRNFEIIGEASKRLPADFKDKHTDIDWQGINGFRNRIVHDYFGIEYSIVWLLKEQFLPDLIIKLSALEL